MVKVTFEPTSFICRECKGELFDPKSQLATQTAVRKKFGMCSDKCINSAYGKVNCPFHNH